MLPREVDVLLGHPLQDVLGALVVAVGGVVAQQLEIDVPVVHRHARVVAERVACLADLIARQHVHGRQRHANAG